MNKKKDQASFSQKMKQLEKIADKFESGDFDLEKDLELYKEGIELSKELKKRLKKIEAEIEEIDKDKELS
jgi:exodeoxyribonuclease VII small subunit